MQYWQHRRARGRMPRVRSAQDGIKEPVLANFVAYKVGMAHLAMVDDSESPSKNMEISVPCTILEVPRVEMYGARFYTKDENGYKKIALELHDKEVSKKLKEKKLKNDETKLGQIKDGIGTYSAITALLVAYPKDVKVGQHHTMRFESAIGGTKEEKLSFISAKLGREVKPSDIFKSGEFIDISSVTKGKGWQGTIKRFGTARLYHKATNKVRHVGTLGPFTPGKVLFTVPQAGQLGFNYRTETNKRILKLGSASDAKEVNPKSGFINYGNVKNDYIIVKGSVGGPAKRLVRLRKSSTRNSKGIKEPKINQISTNA
ncbi:MAG: 50S ribosomal protein L3 [Candidatus Micrarchaeota archaeon]|nr:50S ribosomal protein L3 [Candidatus Micrarchaeota archaeon]